MPTTARIQPNARTWMDLLIAMVGSNPWAVNQIVYIREEMERNQPLICLKCAGEALERLSPVRYEHINVFGKYSFERPPVLTDEGLRPLVVKHTPN